MFTWRDQHGAVAISEYIMTVLLVVIVIVAMTSYIQKSLQARMRDARQYAITTVSHQCDANCMQATGLPGNQTVGSQYEPYYQQQQVSRTRDSVTQKGLLSPGIGTTGIFIANGHNQTQSNADNNQLSPAQAAQDFVLGNK